MTEWIVRSWKRRGHDRLYAATPGGTDLGYLDVATGRYHSDDIANLPLLRKAIEDHLAAQRQPTRPPVVAPVVPARHASSPVPAGSMPASPPAVGSSPAEPGEAAAVPPTPATAPTTTAAPAPAPGLAGPDPEWGPNPGPNWHDLATVRAGSAARERAIAEREAQGILRHVLARVLGAKTDERAWRIGADGEEAVAQQLATLGTQWRILHSVRVGDRGADIDHVVISPGGVFTVNTKHHPRASIWVGGDTFMVNGSRVPYIRNSRHEARRASRLLAQQVGFPVPTTGLIAVVGAQRGFTVKSQPADRAVAVVPRRGIRRFLQSQPQKLSFREVDAIHEAARRSSTWHS